MKTVRRQIRSYHDVVKNKYDENNLLHNKQDLDRFINDLSKKIFSKKKFIMDICRMFIHGYNIDNNIVGPLYLIHVDLSNKRWGDLLCESLGVDDITSMSGKSVKNMKRDDLCRETGDYIGDSLIFNCEIKDSDHDLLKDPVDISKIGVLLFDDDSECDKKNESMVGDYSSVVPRHLHGQNHIYFKEWWSSMLLSLKVKLSTELADVISSKEKCARNLYADQFNVTRLPSLILECLNDDDLYLDDTICDIFDLFKYYTPISDPEVQLVCNILYKFMLQRLSQPMRFVLLNCGGIFEKYALVVQKMHLKKNISLGLTREEIEKFVSIIIQRLFDVSFKETYDFYSQYDMVNYLMNISNKTNDLDWCGLSASNPMEMISFYNEIYIEVNKINVEKILMMTGCCDKDFLVGSGGIERDTTGRPADLYVDENDFDGSCSLSPYNEQIISNLKMLISSYFYTIFKSPSTKLHTDDVIKSLCLGGQLTLNVKRNIVNIDTFKEKYKMNINYTLNEDVSDVSIILKMYDGSNDGMVIESLLNCCTFRLIYDDAGCMFIMISEKYLIDPLTCSLLKLTNGSIKKIGYVIERKRQTREKRKTSREIYLFQYGF